MQDSIDDKMDKLTSMISMLTAQNNIQNKQFKSKIYQGRQRGRGKSRNYYHQNNYDQGNYQNRCR